MSSKLGVSGAGKRALAPPSPSPSNASNASHGTPSSKRQKREKDVTSIRHGTPTPTPAAIAAAAQANYGSDMLTQLTYAVEFLKAKAAPKTLQEVLDHLTLQHAADAEQQKFALLMRKHGRIQFIASSRVKGSDLPQWRTGKYEFRAKIPGVNTKATLLEHLQRKTDASKLDVKDLKDGWPDCDRAIDELESDHKILVVRTKKDGHAKFIWSDDPPLFHPVDAEFRNMWQKVELPSLDDIVRKLVAVGQKPASEDPRLKAKETMNQKKQKKRINRTNKRVTNEHMKHLLKDYSHLKRG